MSANHMNTSIRKVGLAVSGGADSVALMVLMAELAGERGFEPVVLHFDHGIRKERIRLRGRWKGK